MRRGVWGLAVLVPALLTGGLTAESAATAQGPAVRDAKSATLNVLTANVLGTVSNPRYPRTGPHNGHLSYMDYPLHLIKGGGGKPVADLVMLEEICLHQARYIAARLPDYDLVFAAKRPDFVRYDDAGRSSAGSCSDGLRERVAGSPRKEYAVGYAKATPKPGDYGQALLVRGTVTRAFAVELPKPATETRKERAKAERDARKPGAVILPPKEHRAACATARLAAFDRAVTACAVHIAPTSDSDAAEQRAQTRALVGSLADERRRGDAVVIAGDFNAKPGATPMRELYRAAGGNYLEADRKDQEPTAGYACRTGPPTCSDGKWKAKYDYIFFSSGTALDGDALLTPHPTRSDHRVLIGQGTLTR